MLFITHIKCEQNPLIALLTVWHKKAQIYVSKEEQNTHEDFTGQNEILNLHEGYFDPLRKHFSDTTTICISRICI
jgi:hypothetical protein